MTLIAFGILTWDGNERRSNRYGTVVLNYANFNGDTIVDNNVDMKAINAFKDKRVKLTAIVRETRESGHCGDLFIGVKPSTPSKGEIITLGVGMFFTENSWDLMMGLKPSDNREDFWFDPRVLYRLHDQTVEIHCELTDEPDHVVEPFNVSEEDIVMIPEDPEAIQVKGKNIVGINQYKPVRVPGTEGLFELVPHLSLVQSDKYH